MVYNLLKIESWILDAIPFKQCFIECLGECITESHDTILCLPWKGMDRPPPLISSLPLLFSMEKSFQQWWHLSILLIHSWNIGSNCRRPGSHRWLAQTGQILLYGWWIWPSTFLACFLLVQLSITRLFHSFPTNVKTYIRFTWQRSIQTSIARSTDLIW